MSTARQERVTKVLTGWRMTLSRDAATVWLRCIDRQPVRTFPRDPGSVFIFDLWASHARSVGGEGDHTHHLHGARRLASDRKYDENFDSSLHLLQLVVPPRVYIPPPSTCFSAVVVEHPVDWRVGDEVVDDPVPVSYTHLTLPTICSV